MDEKLAVLAADLYCMFFFPLSWLDYYQFHYPYMKIFFFFPKTVIYCMTAYVGLCGCFSSLHYFLEPFSSGQENRHRFASFIPSSKPTGILLRSWLLELKYHFPLLQNGAALIPYQIPAGFEELQPNHPGWQKRVFRFFSLAKN